jgi:hypothetical protein
MARFERISRPRLISTLCVAVLFLGACERSEIDGIGSFTPDEVAPPQHDLVSLDDCSVGEWGWVSGEGEINNGSTSVSTYEVVLGFYDGERRLGDQNTWIRDLDPGESARFEVYAWLDDHASAMSACEVLTINRWSARSES